MKKTDGGVTAAKGFLAASTAAGIKYKDRMDMAMIYSEKPCKAAGTFTTNIVKAAPVKWDQNVVYNHPSAQAVICNSGIANACTGAEGYGYCKATADAASEILGIPADSVLVASTGVIGMQIPIDRIVNGVKAMAPKLDGSLEAGTEAAKAIMTTDTVPKQYAVKFMLGDCECTVGGMAKGSGMIHPNMATTLNFITSDVAISSELIQKALSEIVKVTYNCLSIDGDTSTNDMVSIMANGLAGNTPITTENDDYQAFKDALYEVLSNLTRMLAKDGEGASKLLECTCAGAPDLDTAIIVAKSVIRSPLLKCAMFGEDANWGRILCAIGYAEADFDIDKVELHLRSTAGCIKVCENGAGVDFSEEEAAKILHEDEIYIDIDLHQGDVSAKAWGCDLTYDYVKINGDYRS